MLDTHKAVHIHIHGSPFQLDVCIFQDLSFWRCLSRGTAFYCPGINVFIYYIYSFYLKYY